MNFFLSGKRPGHGWETYPNPELKLSDLDEEEIRKTVRLGIESGRLPETTGNEIPGILEKLNILENGILNNAAEISVSFQTTYSYFFQIRYTVSVFVPCIFKPNSLFTFTGTEQWLSTSSSQGTQNCRRNNEKITDPWIIAITQYRFPSKML